MGALMDLDVIRANVWRVIQLRTFLCLAAHTHKKRNMLMQCVLPFPLSNT